MYEADGYVIKGAGAGEIAGSIEDAIRSGRLDPGEQLPPIRDLAERLNVSPSTVGAAYRTLRHRGMVTTHGRGGTKVSLGPPLPARGPVPIPMGARDLAHGNPNRELLPPLEMILEDFDSTSYLYDEQPYLDPLLELAAQRFAAAGVPTDNVTVVNGAMDAHQRVLDVSLRRGDQVAIEDPGLPHLIDLVSAMGFRIVPVRVDDRGVVPEALKRVLDRGVKAVTVTPRAHNPTGARLDAERVEQLRAVLAGRPGTLLIENDHAGEVADAPPFTLTGTAMERWVVIHSVSKTLGPDFRLATVAGDARTIARVEGRMLLGTAWVSSLLQQLVVRLWSHPATPGMLDTARIRYGERRRALIDALEGRGIGAQGRSGLNVWIPVENEGAAFAGLLEAGWGVSPGSRFRLNSGPGLRVTITTLPPEDAQQLANDLAGVLRPSHRIYGA